MELVKDTLRKGGFTMISKRDKKVLTRTMSIVVGALLLGVEITPQVTSAAALTELVAKAKQEGALNATVTLSIGEKTAVKLIPLFKKRFGLDIEVTITPLRSTNHYGRAAAATRAGAPPTYDTIEGSELANVQLIGLGGTQKIDDWKSLLAEIHPLVGSGKVRPEQISPDPFTGEGFKYLSRIKGILYNPKLISKRELPKTHAELANPKYKDRWTQPPWSSHWELGPLIFPDIDQENWLEIVRKAGKNAGAVLSGSKGVRRVLIGQYAFALASTHQALRAKDMDPKAPLEVAYFKDYNQTNSGFYVVRKGARHPAAGTLFALWMSTPEAKAIWQPRLYGTQFLWGESELDRKVRRLIKQSGAKIVDYLDSKKGVALLKWYGSEEGRMFSKALSRAIRGR